MIHKFYIIIETNIVFKRTIQYTIGFDLTKSLNLVLKLKTEDM